MYIQDSEPRVAIGNVDMCTFSDSSPVMASFLWDVILKLAIVLLCVYSEVDNYYSIVFHNR